MSKIISLIAIVAVLVFIISAVYNRSTKDEAQNTIINATATTTPITTKVVVEQGIEIPLADGHYTVNPSDISLNWTGRKVVLKKWIDKGSISLKEASFDVKNGDVVMNKFVIDMNSIKPLTTGAGGGQDRLSTHLKSADFFDAAQYPTATFVAKELTASSSNIFILKGDLTIKDKTNEISIPITLDRSKTGVIAAKGSVDLDRTKWDVRYGSGKFFEDLGDKIIDDMFNVSFEIKVNTAAVKSDAIEAKIKVEAI